MIKIENIETYRWHAAILGMRNPMYSWFKSDSQFDGDKWCLGENDLKLMQSLSKAGTDHSKFLRMIVSGYSDSLKGHVIEEIADVWIMITQIIMMLKAENEVDEYKKYKVERQLGRMALE